MLSNCPSSQSETMFHSLARNFQLQDDATRSGLDKPVSSTSMRPFPCFALHSQPTTCLWHCRYDGREIAAYDIQTQRCDVYGSEEGYSEHDLGVPWSCNSAQPCFECRYYGREIAAYDIQTQRCDVYGSEEGYSERAMVLYDGLHYDALALAGE